MTAGPLFKSIELTNILSFGPSGAHLDLKPLNLLIGPNGSGKSNLIEAFGLLAAAPTDILGPIRDGGGVGEWLWKGATAPPTAKIEVLLEHTWRCLRYGISFTTSGQRFEIEDEFLENETAKAGETKPFFFYRIVNGYPTISSNDGGRRQLKREDVSPVQSVLSQRRDSEIYPEMTHTGDTFRRIKTYREWTFGRYTSARMPQKVDLPEDFLLADASNLGLVLNHLENIPETKARLIHYLRKLYDRVSGFHTRVQGGTIQVYFHEDGLREAVPATRLSDGTLRYLSLLAILCHPTPPPFICIEEPELGLHPDAISVLGELMIEASTRTQLVVTTHSEILVSAFSHSPDSVVVCRRDDDGTQFERLDGDELAGWLERYRLGELWMRGDIGGTRW